MGWREQMAAATADIQEIEAQLASALAENSTLTSQIAANDAEILALESRIAELEAQQPTPEPTPIPEPVPAGLVLAMYGGSPQGGISKVDAASTWIGKEIKTGVAFCDQADTDWSNIEDASWTLGPWSTWMAAKPGRNFHYRLCMMPRNGTTLAQVASGVHKEHYVACANRLMQYGFTDIEIAIGWEFDLKLSSNFLHRCPPGSGLQDEFRAAWRHIVTTMRQAQPNNRWRFCWNPTEDRGTDRAYLESCWPGNDVVDTVGVDAYDFSWWNIDGVSVYYPSTCDAACRLSRQQKVWPFRLARLNGLAQLARDKGKPMSFPEWGCATWKSPTSNIGHAGGDNPYYIQKMHEFFTNPSNNVAMQAYFNRENTNLDHKIGNGSSTLPTAFPQASAKYKQLFGA